MWAKPVGQSSKKTNTTSAKGKTTPSKAPFSSKKSTSLSVIDKKERLKHVAVKGFARIALDAPDLLPWKKLLPGTEFWTCQDKAYSNSRNGSRQIHPSASKKENLTDSGRFPAVIQKVIVANPYDLVLQELGRRHSQLQAQKVVGSSAKYGGFGWTPYHEMQGKNGYNYTQERRNSAYEKFGPITVVKPGSLSEPDWSGQDNPVFPTFMIQRVVRLKLIRGIWVLDHDVRTVPCKKLFKTLEEDPEVRECLDENNYEGLADWAEDGRELYQLMSGVQKIMNYKKLEGITRQSRRAPKSEPGQTVAVFGEDGGIVDATPTRIIDARLKPGEPPQIFSVPVEGDSDQAYQAALTAMDKNINS